MTERGMRFEDGVLHLLDQTELPHAERWLRLTSAQEVAEAIKRLAVRGAPAIGLAAAYGLAVEAIRGGDVEAAAGMLAATRPTAVNLRWAIERSLAAGHTAEALTAAAEQLALDQLEQDQAIGRNGAELLGPDARVLTHCNAGALATGGAGTAGAVLQQAWEDGRLEKVWVDETRPLLQGARITAWELTRADVPFEVVPDSAAGALMARGEVDAVVVGADRIAANGDVANKVGTYALAVLAHRHGIPFYVAAPTSTVDPKTPDGTAIPIEERSPHEVTSLGGNQITPEHTKARNLAFDVTPNDLVTGIVTEKGVAGRPRTPGHP